MAISLGRRLREDTASYPQHAQALALPPHQLRNPPGLAAFSIAPFAAHLGGNAGGLLLLSVSIFRAWRGFWQQRQPAHAAPSSASLAEGLAALPGCGFRRLSLPCRVPVHLPVAPARQSCSLQAGQSRRAGLGGGIAALPRAAPSGCVYFLLCPYAVRGFHGGHGVLCGHGAGWRVARVGSVVGSI